MIYGVELVGGAGVVLHADGFDHGKWVTFYLRNGDRTRTLIAVIDPASVVTISIIKGKDSWGTMQGELPPSSE